MKKSDTNLKAIDYFCSGGGMTYGMRQAGIDVLAGIDIDPVVKPTFELNNPGSKFIQADIFRLPPKQVEKILGIKKKDDHLILIGCSPCQYWSIINTDKGKSKQSKDLLKEFHKHVKYFQPGYVIVENVPGLERKAEESGLRKFIVDLEKMGYKITSKVYSLNDYGVPQSRKRFSLIASRIKKNKIEPLKSEYQPVVRDFLGQENGFPKVCAGARDKSDLQHTVSNLSDENLEAIRNTPKNGGNSPKQRKSYKGKGFADSYGRMSWDKPAPTITTNYFKLSSGRFGHPDEDRAISLREGATLQTFPKDYIFFSKSITAIAKMVGNAVPPEFARRIGVAIQD